MKELTVIFFSSWKFALTFPVAVYCMHMSFFETLFYTNLGGIIGVIFFTFLSKLIIQLWNKYVQPLLFKQNIRKPIFSKRRKLFITIKNKYGLPGIIILNPIILSIPISTFLLTKYYGRKNKYLILLVAGQFAWSLIYTFFYLFVYMKIF